MQRGKKPYRVYAADGSMRDLEARDDDEARDVAAHNLIAGKAGIKRIEPLPPDEVRPYDVLFAKVTGDDRYVPIPHSAVRRAPVNAKSSTEATKIAQAEIDMGAVPDVELMQTLVRAVNAVPIY